MILSWSGAQSQLLKNGDSWSISFFFSLVVITKDAGKADLALNIVSPSGRNVPYNISKKPDGSGVVVEYVPMEAGPHQVYVTYGDLEVAGKSWIVCEVFVCGW